MSWLLRASVSVHLIPNKTNPQSECKTLCCAHMAKLAQSWIATNCSEFIGKDEWPPNLPDLNPLDYHVRGARPMLERYKSFQPKPENTDELKKVLQLIWDQLQQDSINKVILSFPKRLQACAKAGGGHFEHTLK